MVVIALETQVDMNGNSYLPNQVFEIEDQEILEYKLRIGLVKEYQEPEDTEDQKPKVTRAKRKVLEPEGQIKIEETE